MVENASMQDMLTQLDQGLDAALDRLQDFLRIPSISTDPAHKGDVRRAAEWLVAQLRDLGFEIPADPDGAFYIYADASAFTHDSLNWCARVLEETGVAITPGVDFGEHEAGAHVRFAFTTRLERLQEAVQRLRDWL